MNGVVPMSVEIVGHLGSLYLAGICSEIMEFTFEAKKAFFGTLVVLLMVHNSLKNLALGGISWIASRRAMFVLT